MASKSVKTFTVRVPFLIRPFRPRVERQFLLKFFTHLTHFPTHAGKRVRKREKEGALRGIKNFFFWPALLSGKRNILFFYEDALNILSRLSQNLSNRHALTAVTNYEGILFDFFIERESYTL